MRVALCVSLSVLLASACSPAHAAPAPVSSAAGMALGTAALHVGSGEHPLAPLIGLWGRLPLGDACFLEPELAAARRREGGALASFERRYYRGALGLGCSAGTRATRVALSLGPALGYRHSRIVDEPWSASSLAPGLRYRAGFLIPLGERLQLDLLAGGSTHGRVVDHDLLLQGGVRW
jgi:hypothetical protein